MLVNVHAALQSFPRRPTRTTVALHRGTDFALAAPLRRLQARRCGPVSETGTRSLSRSSSLSGSVADIGRTVAIRIRRRRENRRQAASSNCGTPSPVAALTGSSSRPRRLKGAAMVSSFATHVGEVDLVDRDDLRALRQLRVVEAQLTIERLEVAQRRPPVARGGVEQVHQHARAFEVAQETIAEPGARGARLRSGPGCRRRRTIARPTRRDHAQVRHQRRERIVGDLRAAPPRRARSATTCRRWESRAARRRPAA